MPPAGYSAHYCVCGNTEAALHQPRAAFLNFFFLALRFSLTLAASAGTFHNQSVSNQLKEIRLLGPNKKSNIFLSPLAVFDISGSQKQKGVAGKAAKLR